MALHTHIKTLLADVNQTRVAANEIVRQHARIQAELQATLTVGWGEITRIKQEGGQEMTRLRAEIIQIQHQLTQTLKNLRAQLSGSVGTPAHPHEDKPEEWDRYPEESNSPIEPGNR